LKGLANEDYDEEEDGDEEDEIIKLIN
jgi:hypothetical protein